MRQIHFEKSLYLFAFAIVFSQFPVRLESKKENESCITQTERTNIPETIIIKIKNHFATLVLKLHCIIFQLFPA